MLNLQRQNFLFGGFDYDDYVAQDIKLRRDYLVGYTVDRAHTLEGIPLGINTFLYALTNTKQRKDVKVLIIGAPLDKD